MPSGSQNSRDIPYCRPPGQPAKKGARLRAIGQIVAAGRPLRRAHYKVAPAETFLLVYRDADDAVQFVEINAFTARLIALLEPGTLTGRAALDTIAAESRHPDPAVIVEAGGALLDDLRARGAIPGLAA